jgi:hypothetical protein
MISLNPFKKKEDDGFKLDEYSLPSLGDDSQTSNSNTSSELPSLGESNAFGNTSMNSSNFGDNASSSNSFNPSYESQSQGIPGISDPIPSSFNSTLVESHIQEQPQEISNSSLHQDIAKAKMETIATKLELMEARQQSMDQKLEQIYQMLAMEISPETKKRLKIKSMMDSIKDS